MLTNKQIVFAEEYLIDCNATRAYKVAYPNIKKDAVARANGSRLLTNANVKKYIEERMEEMSSKRIATSQEVMEYLTSVMRGESKSSVLSLSGDGYQEVIEKEPDEKEKLKAAELLGKRYALFTDKSQINGNVQIVFSEDLGDIDDEPLETD